MTTTKFIRRFDAIDLDRSALPSSAPRLATDCSTTSFLILDAAIQGVGLAWTSEFAAAPHVAAGRLVQALEDWTAPFPGLALFYPGHRHVPAGLRAFIEVIRERNSAQIRKRPLPRR